MNDLSGNSLKFEAEFFRKSNNRTLTREKKIRSIQMRTVHVLVLLALTLLVGFTVYKTAVFLLKCDTLQVHSFRLHQQPVFEKERVWGILKRSTGNILTLNLGELRAQLLRLPEIEDVAVSRILPDTVEINFKLRQPFYHFYKNGVYQLLDAGGLVLGEQRTMPAGLIPIRGSDGSVLVQIAAFSQELLPLRNKIEYVIYSEPYGIELKLLAEPEVFYPGENDFIKKLNRYFKIKPHLVLNGSIIRYVDLRIAGRIYFEYLSEPQGDS
jgi:cell division septal protein FtsQ